jgi:pantoate--beta-alanine ligase
LKIFKTTIQLRQWTKTLPNKSVGFIPTMGALHEGHFSLIRASKKECQKTIVSIFVNKPQFGPNEDFNTYPRLMERDIKLLNSENVDVLFCPGPEEIYPKDFSFKINENKIANQLEGKSRPGFFDGVCLVVLKLFNITQPKRVYFGEKDIQQLYIIQKMIKDFNFPIQLRGCPTVREKNGLAMSSRNQYLSDVEKEEASVLYKTLKKGATCVLDGQLNVDTIITMMGQLIVNKNIKIDYLEIRDLNTFNQITKIHNQPIIIVGAIYYKKIRLIDNIILK